MSGEAQQKIDFSGLVAGLTASAVAVLAQVETVISGEPQNAGEDEESEELEPEEQRRRASEGLQGARQLIDTLVVLQEKTKGNLTGEEEELLSSSLSELRIRYVGLANRVSAGGEKGEAG